MNKDLSQDLARVSTIATRFLEPDNLRQQISIERCYKATKLMCELTKEQRAVLRYFLSQPDDIVPDVSCCNALYLLERMTLLVSYENTVMKGEKRSEEKGGGNEGEKKEGDSGGKEHNEKKAAVVRLYRFASPAARMLVQAKLAPYDAYDLKN